MTKDEKTIVDRVYGYLLALSETRRNSVTIPSGGISELKRAYIILGKEIFSIEHTLTSQAAELGVCRDEIKEKRAEIKSLKEKLRQKTYPIDREYKLKKEIEENKLLLLQKELTILALQDEIKKINNDEVALRNKLVLQIIEIGKLQGLLKEADEKLNEANIKIEDLQNIIEGLHMEDGLNLEKITELKQTLERVRMEVVEQTARSNEDKINKPEKCGYCRLREVPEWISTEGECPLKKGESNGKK